MTWVQLACHRALRTMQYTCRLELASMARCYAAQPVRTYTADAVLRSRREPTPTWLLMKLAE